MQDLTPCAFVTPCAFRQTIRDFVQSRLPQDIQHDVFEAAVTLEGEVIRQQLAIYLHSKHTRTTDAMQVRATPEPDSLGG